MLCQIMANGGNMNHGTDFTFRIIVVGETGVGKTAISKRFKWNEFEGTRAATVIAERFDKEVTVMGKNIQIEIYATSGNQMYQTQVDSYFTDMAGVLLVYDVTCLKTFNKLHSWLLRAKDHLPESTFLIVGNKIDRIRERLDFHSDVEKFACDEDLDHVFMSAKSGENVQELFEYLTWKILQKKRLIPSTCHMEKPLAQSIGEVSVHGEDLPPTCPLPDDVNELRVDITRKMSSDSLSSLIENLDDFQDYVRVYREAQAEEAEIAPAEEAHSNESEEAHSNQSEEAHSNQSEEAHRDHAKVSSIAQEEEKDDFICVIM